jgi:hypothetical protein
MKRIILSISVASALGIMTAQSAYADYTVYDDSNHLYIGAGVNAYHYKFADMNSLASNGSAQTTPSINNDYNTVMPIFALGYHFNNELLTPLFGEKANIELDGSFFSHNASTAQGDLGLGFVSMVDGNNANVNLADIRNFQLNTNDHYQYAGLYFKGDQSTDNQAVTTDPFVGFVYMHFSKTNNYTMQIDGGSSNYFDYNAQENTNTNYYGLGIGDQVNLQLSEHLFINANAAIQLLYASSSLNANSAIPDEDLNATANNKLSTITYHATLGSSVSYHFTFEPDSPTLGLNVGVDRFGYTPEIVNPTSTQNQTTNQPAAYIGKEGGYGLFAGIYFHLPL